MGYYYSHKLLRVCVIIELVTSTEGRSLLIQTDFSVVNSFEMTFPVFSNKLSSEETLLLLDNNLLMRINYPLMRAISLFMEINYPLMGAIYLFMGINYLFMEVKRASLFDFG